MTTFQAKLVPLAGVAPPVACDTAAKGMRRQVTYQADYVFYYGS